LISPADARTLDANAEALGIPTSLLMDNAGAALASFIGKEYPDKRAVFVCGTGNNGGDGFAAALRMDPERTKVCLLKKPSSIRTEIARERYSVLECPIEAYAGKDSFAGFDLIVDCALGTGTSGSVREPYASFIADANSSGLPIISADVPSGFGSDVCIKPCATVTFHDAKIGMTAENCGKIVIAGIGIPEEAYTRVGPGDMLRYPVPLADSHKGNNGRLMIIGGGPYFGAPAMSAMSALRIGADIVRVFTPESSYPQVAAASPVLMATKLPGDHLDADSLDIILSASKDFDAVLIGPGLGSDEMTIRTAMAFLRACKIPTVIDADGISAAKGLTLRNPTVLTPHSREFSRISDGKSPEETASKMGATILKKGKVDLITDGTRTRYNSSGTPAMTGAGTGDVLAGAVAGLMAKGMGPFDAACLGAYICGRAGEKAFETKSYGLIATDVIDCIPTILSEGLR
jgi:NAD(P)H-hydrate epimerase